MVTNECSVVMVSHAIDSFMVGVALLLQISILKRGLRHQAEGVLTLSGFCQQLYAAKMELIDLLPDEPKVTPQLLQGVILLLPVRIIH